MWTNVLRSHQEYNSLWLCIILYNYYNFLLSFISSWLFYRGPCVELDCFSVQHIQMCLVELEEIQLYTIASSQSVAVLKGSPEVCKWLISQLGKKRDPLAPGRMRDFWLLSCSHHTGQVHPWVAPRHLYIRGNHTSMYLVNKILKQYSAAFITCD